MASEDGFVADDNFDISKTANNEETAEPLLAVDEEAAQEEITPEKEISKNLFAREMPKERPQPVQNVPEQVRPEPVRFERNIQPTISDADIDRILPKPTFSDRPYNEENFQQNDLRLGKTGRGPDREPRKTPDRSRGFERNISDLVQEERPEPVQFARPQPVERPNPIIRPSAPVQASFLPENKRRKNVLCEIQSTM